jgi:curved DNA-binding protein CbpA
VGNLQSPSTTLRLENMNPYLVLQVEQHASAAEIKRAYRNLAQKLHPDREGGDEEKFQELQAAYAILSDENKRAEYDRTGEVKEDHTNYEASAAQTLKNLFQMAIVEQIEMVKPWCLEKLEGSIANMHLQLAQEKRHYNSLSRYRNRVIRKNKGPNLFSEVLEDNLRSVAFTIKNMETGIKISRMSLLMLHEYDHNDGRQEPNLLQKGFATVKSLFALVAITVALLLSGVANAGDYSYYVKVGAGYKVAEPDHAIFVVDGESRELWLNTGSPISARMEVGIETGSLTFGVAHYSQWFDGWPVNEREENYKTEIFVDYKFSFGGN